MKIIFLGLSIVLLSTTSFSQNEEGRVLNNGVNVSKQTEGFSIKPAFDSSDFSVDKIKMNQQLVVNTKNWTRNTSFDFKNGDVTSEHQSLLLKTKLEEPHYHSLLKNGYANFSVEENEPIFKNKRNLYSSMWAFASLNYIYADLIGLMDKNILSQYQTGVVNNINITPNFLASAAVFMQIPLANVFLPHLIKNERALRWVQISSGALMSVIQTSTLFVGKPTPHYAVFSAFEIAATTFITIDAIKWKAKKRTKPQNLSD